MAEIGVGLGEVGWSGRSGEVGNLPTFDEILPRFCRDWVDLPFHSAQVFRKFWDSKLVMNDAMMKFAGVCIL